MSIVKITTPLNKAPYGQDGYYVLGNYVAVVAFSTINSLEPTVVMVIDSQNDHKMVAEYVIKPDSSYLCDRATQWKKWVDKIQTDYENQKNN
jgi:hypothetical protein